jgi:LmbE family N-acetylglucosaminyl deacetylase
VILVIQAHADDAVLWCGGTMRRWADEGHRVVLARVTNDENAGIGRSAAETIRTTTEQYHRSAAVLGVAETIDLGFPADRLIVADRIALRERLVHLYRRFRPYSTCTFDPYAVLYENNQDHLVVAQAADEAFWMAASDRYVQSDLAVGLQLHGVVERWYFGRRVPEVSVAVDIAPWIERKIEAVLAQTVMLENEALQLRLQAETAGRRVPMLDEAAAGNLEPLVRHMITSDAARAGRAHGLALAEEYRVARFAAGSGPMEDLLDSRPPP